MKIAVAGTGYVGISNAVLLAQKNDVWAVDILPEKVHMLNHRISPIADPEIEEYLNTKPLNLTATTDGCLAYADAEFVIVATPTNDDKRSLSPQQRVWAILSDLTFVTACKLRNCLKVGI